MIHTFVTENAALPVFATNPLECCRVAALSCAHDLGMGITQQTSLSSRVVLHNHRIAYGKQQSIYGVGNTIV
jgi:hypothetical protein